jgi:hypothetical protein
MWLRRVFLAFQTKPKKHGIYEPERERFMNRPKIVVSETNDLDLPAKAILSPIELAEFLGITVQALAQWRCNGEGPVYMKCGRAVRYRRRAIADYLEGRTGTSTTALSAAGVS